MPLIILIGEYIMSASWQGEAVKFDGRLNSFVFFFKSVLCSFCGRGVLDDAIKCWLYKIQLSAVL